MSATVYHLQHTASLDVYFHCSDLFFHCDLVLPSPIFRLRHLVQRQQEHDVVNCSFSAVIRYFAAAAVVAVAEFLFVAKFLNDSLAANSAVSIELLP